MINFRTHTKSLKIAYFEVQRLFFTRFHYFKKKRVKLINLTECCHFWSKNTRNSPQHPVGKCFLTFTYSVNILAKFTAGIILPQICCVEKSNSLTTGGSQKKNLRKRGSLIMMSILRLHMMVIKNPQNVQKISYQLILMTFICNIKNFCSLATTLSQWTWML